MDLMRISSVCREWQLYFNPRRRSLLRNPLDWSIAAERLDLIEFLSRHESYRRLLCEKYQKLILSWDSCFLYLPQRSFVGSLFFAMGIHNVSENFLQEVWYWIHSQSSYSTRLEEYHAARLYEGDKEHLQRLFSQGQNKVGIFTFKMSLDYTVSFQYWIERHHIIDKERIWRVLGCVSHPCLLRTLEQMETVRIPWTRILQYAFLSDNDIIQGYILDYHANEIYWDAIIDSCIHQNKIDRVEKFFDYGLPLVRLWERLRMSGKVYSVEKRDRYPSYSLKDLLHRERTPTPLRPIALNI
jgi:hypothetical protein